MGSDVFRLICDSNGSGARVAGRYELERGVGAPRRCSPQRRRRRCRSRLDPRSKLETKVPSWIDFDRPSGRDSSSEIHRRAFDLEVLVCRDSPAFRISSFCPYNKSLFFFFDLINCQHLLYSRCHVMKRRPFVGLRVLKLQVVPIVQVNLILRDSQLLK